MDKRYTIEKYQFFWLHYSNRLNTEQFIYDDNSPMSDWELVEFTLDEAVEYVKNHEDQGLSIIDIYRSNM